MSETIGADAFITTLARVAARLVGLKDRLNELDAAMGDGDLGITAAKGGASLQEYLAHNAPGDDLGKFLVGAGMAFNRAAPSTMGTLIATALMWAGKEAKGVATLDNALLAKMFLAADSGIQERGKAKVGDKTVVDALHPAAEAFAAATGQGASRKDAGQAMLAAARAGRDAAIPLRSQIGRAGWVGERTENLPDPGTVLVVDIIETVVGAAYSEPGSTLKSKT